jgi:hypothetical protein
MRSSLASPPPTSLPSAGRATGRKGAEAIVRMATIGRDGPTGTFQEGDGEIRW